MGNRDDWARGTDERSRNRVNAAGIINGLPPPDVRMPMTNRHALSACIALVAFATLPAPAVAAPMQPGMWELVMAVTADGQTEVVPAGRGCISAKDIADPTKTLPRPAGQCTLSNVQRTADRATYDIACKDKQVTTRGQAEIILGGDRYDGKVALMMTGREGTGVPVDMTFSAKRVGDCTP